MLKRLYVDNYKCLVNFEYQPGQVQLIVGGNGSGKSTVFDVLSLLRAFLLDGVTTAIFAVNTLTRWQERNYQTFEIDLQCIDGEYHYQLIIEHMISDKKNRVFHEEILYNGKPLFLSDIGKAQLFRDNSNEGPTVLLDWSRSGLSLIQQRRDNIQLMHFKDLISQLYCFKLDPRQMLSTSNQEEVDPRQNLANYASWYRHLTQEQPNTIFHLREYLKELFDDFDSLSLAKESENARILKAEYRTEDVLNVKYDFEELSDGQRTLICLYTLLAIMKETPITLCIDEPENFVMFAEIQPWLMELQQQAEEHCSQTLIISHHPELINYLVPVDAIRFDRKREGPTRVKQFAPLANEPITPAEIIARGWDNE